MPPKNNLQDILLRKKDDTPSIVEVATPGPSSTKSFKFRPAASTRTPVSAGSSLKSPAARSQPPSRQRTTTKETVSDVIDISSPENSPSRPVIPSKRPTPEPLNAPFVVNSSKRPRQQHNVAPSPLDKKGKGKAFDPILQFEEDVLPDAEPVTPQNLLDLRRTWDFDHRDLQIDEDVIQRARR
ncbi:hypothetical protein K474DRAFT_1387710 [Panus rudis PR-1116 ss-1]|nr:hypothetical protein K474DRAFT_1387710 [Panus rudis PR-1116 ss-1]